VSVLTTILALAVVLGVLIFVHEAGHFLAAKWAGIYVHRFSLGLGSPIKALTFRRGETEYSISWLPLGGYVKMASREEDAASAMLEGGAGTPVPPDRVFEAQPVWKRMVVILAGVTMNVVFAWLVFIGLAFKNGREVDPTTVVGRVADSLPPGAEALRAIRPGARIVAISGRPVHTWDEVQDLIANDPSSQVTLRFADSSTVVLPIHPDALADRLRASQALAPLRAPVVGRLLAGKPAARAGILPGDTVVSAGGEPIGQWADLLRVIEASGGRRIDLEVHRNGKTLAFALTPETDTVLDEAGKARAVGKIGIGLKTDTRFEPYTFTQAVAAGSAMTLESATQVVRTVRGLASGRVATREVGGPIFIGQMAGETARLGIDPFLGFMAIISVNLAILNLLPVPVLDGGQFLLLFAEAVLRRPIPPKLREGLTALGLVLVVLLMGLAFSNDIRRIFGG
jgi:regulator of sigma E protease